jgi:hypothetical protein
VAELIRVSTLWISFKFMEMNYIRRDEVAILREIQINFGAAEGIK